MNLKFNEYRLYALRPYSMVFWINNMGEMYQWDFDKEDMVKSELAYSDLPTNLLKKTSPNLRELVKISKKEKIIFELKNVLALPGVALWLIVSYVKNKIVHILKKFGGKK